MDVSVHSNPLSLVQSACIKTSLESCYKGTQPPCFSEAELFQPPTLGMVGNSSTGKIQDDPEKIEAAVNATLEESRIKSTQKDVKTTDVGGNSSIVDPTIPANGTIQSGLDYQAPLPSSEANVTLKTSTTPSSGANATLKASTTPSSGANATLKASTSPSSGANATLNTSTSPSSGAITTLKTSTTPSGKTNATTDILALRLASEANASIKEKANPSRYI